MKIFGIGDLLIPEKYIKEGFEPFLEKGYSIETIQWKLKDYEELQNINLKIELGGSEAYEVDDDIIDRIKEAEILITQFFPINKKVIDACKNLKIIGVLRGGCENININYATEKGIVVCNTPGRNANAVADFTVGMLISECRNIAKSYKNLKEGKWVRDYDNAATVPDLSGKTVGIIGFGEIGRKVAKRLNGFDMNILVYDPFVKNYPDYVTLTSLEDLMKKSMFVTIHSRLCKETEHMINKDMLSLMRNDAYFINTARSGLVDEKALYEVLRDKKIAGAAIDVFDVEPMPIDYPYNSLENITITPHLAGGTVDAFTSSPKLLQKNIMTLIEEKPKNSAFVVNKELIL